MSNRSLTPRHTPFTNLEKQFEGLLSNFFGGSPFGSLSSAVAECDRFSPSINLTEDDDKVTIQAELPGVPEDAVEIIATQDSLTLRGEKKEETRKEGENSLYIERSFGSFERTFALPAEVDRDKADAAFENGVLTISLPKTQAAKETIKKIGISKKK